MFEGRAGMDDLETRLAADEASIRDDGFSARVTDQALNRSRFRRVWLAGAAFLGGAAASLSIAPLTSVLRGAMDNLAPAQFVLSLPVAELSMQLPGETLVGVALAGMIALGALAMRFAGDDL